MDVSIIKGASLGSIDLIQPLPVTVRAMSITKFRRWFDGRNSSSTLDRNEIRNGLGYGKLVRWQIEVGSAIPVCMCVRWMYVSRSHPFLLRLYREKSPFWAALDADHFLELQFGLL